MKQVLILGLMLVVLAVSACSGLPGGSPPPTSTRVPSPVPTQAPTQPPTPTATPTVAPTPTPTTVPTPANPLEGLTKAFRGWGSVKSLRAKMTTTGLPTGTQETNLEVVLPDRFRMTSKQMELIMIGKTVYVKVGNQWQKVAMPKGIDLSLADPKKFEENLGVTTDVKLVGTELLDGTPTFVYQYTTTIKGPPAQKFTSKVWIGVSDNLPRKLESEPKAGQKTTVIYYDYNANITINPPIP